MRNPVLLSEKRPAKRVVASIAGALIALLLTTQCGIVDGGDQWFTLTIKNDTATTVVLNEPCPKPCKPGFLTKIVPGKTYNLAVVANGGAKTYLVTDEAGLILGCLPTTYSKVPAAKAVSLSNVEIPCGK